MKSISFDNPYLLLLFIPIALIFVLTYFIIGNKDNKGLGWRISLILHLAIGALVSLGLAGLMSVSVLTQTTVYVVADVSYSSERNFDEIDEYIAGIKKAMPANSKLGVICFGKNTELLVSPGRTLKSVSKSNVDDSATDIAKALNYAGTRFKGNTLNRVVLITDGNDTVNKQTGTIATAVDNLTSAGVKIDVIYLNNNLQEGDEEVQLTDAIYTQSLYKDHKNVVQLLVQSTSATSGKVNLYVRDYGEETYELLEEMPIFVEEGFNTVAVELPNDEAGTYEYKAVLAVDKDFSSRNNEFRFIQTVEGTIKILHLTGKTENVDFMQSVYGDSALVETFLVKGNGSFEWFFEGEKTVLCKGRYYSANCGEPLTFTKEDIIKNNGKIYCTRTDGDKEFCDGVYTLRVPYSIEELATYDEIVISDLDVRNIKNANTFMDSLDVVVSQYGKGLFVFGDLNLQTDKDDKILEKLADMLPVQYGNANKAGKLYTIAIDTSGSMFKASKFENAKKAAVQLLSILDEQDQVCIIPFAGEVNPWQTKYATKENRTALAEDIMDLKPGGNTNLYGSIEEALKEIERKGLALNNVMIISDGMGDGDEVARDRAIASIVAKGGTVSCINTYSQNTGDPLDVINAGRNRLREIASKGKGYCYSLQSERDIDSIVFGSIVEDLSEPIVNKDSGVVIERYDETILNGFDFHQGLPNVSTYIKSVEKAGVTVPLQIYCDDAFDGKVPLYAYRLHGNGKVSAWTTGLGTWTKNWSNEDVTRFFQNVAIDTTPPQKVDYPFTMKVESNDFETRVEITPSVSQLYSKATLRIQGNGVDRTVDMVKESGVYAYTFESNHIGSYKLTVTYHYSYQRTENEELNKVPYEEVHTAEWYIEKSYLPEYDAFESFDSAKIYDFMRGNGTINLGTIPNLENKKGEISTYMVSYRIPLLIAAVVLFIADIIVRKIRFKDKRFKKLEKEKAAKENPKKQKTKKGEAV